MSASVLKNLRDTLGIPQQGFALKAGIPVNRLIEIERGESPPSDACIDAYSEILGLGTRILRVLLVGYSRRIPGFEPMRSFALKVLDGYLRLCLWMMAFNETEEKVPR